MVFTFSIFDRKHSSWGNLVEKLKIVSLNWNWYLGLFEYAELIGEFFSTTSVTSIQISYLQIHNSTVNLDS